MIRNGTIDGKNIAWDDEHTEFLVQVGKGPKGSYKTCYKIVGNLAQAAALYRAINIGLGFKKRLRMPSCSKNPTLARMMS